MSKRDLFLPFSVLALLSAGTLPATAAEPGFYLGGAYGQSDLRDACDGEFDPAITCDDSDEGWKALGGYRFNRNWAVEAAWVELGAARAELLVDDFEITAEFKVDGYYVAAVGMLPLGEHFDLFAKVGAFEWDVDTGLAFDEIPFFDETTGEALLLGAGADLNLSQRFALRAEWERFFEVGDAEVTGETDIDLASIGFVVRF